VKRNVLTLFWFLIVVVSLPETVGAADPAGGGGRDLASEVRAVFAAKCTRCHGPDVLKPKGRFGYVTDLKRVAANPEMVVPGSPAESELWELVSRGEMPPADSPTGALTSKQKEVIRSWIAAGAPTTTTSSSPTPSDAAPDEEGTAAPTARPTGLRLLTWIGKFHLLFLHFPIALFLAAAAGEFLAVLRKSRVPAPAVRYAVLLAASSAVSTATLGWLHALSGEGASLPRILLLHRWLGTAAALFAVTTAFFSERDSRRGERSMLGRVLLFAGAALVAMTAHFGGLLAHGLDFFDW
jgi:uncharacterized membrane protein/mono/diheme cytochrome c family protein